MKQSAYVFLYFLHTGLRSDTHELLFVKLTHMVKGYPPL